MRQLAVVVALVAACSLGCKKEGSSGPRLPAEDYADRFTGVWYGSVGGSSGGEEIPPEDAVTEITSDVANHLAIGGVCPDGSPAAALVTGPATLSVVRGSCPAAPIGDCAAVTFVIQGGLGIRTSDTLSLVFDGELRGCDVTVPVELVFGGSRTPPQPPVTVAPAVARLEPTGATAGDPPLELVVRGTGFQAGSQVHFDYRPRATTFVSEIELHASLTAEDLALAGLWPVHVVNPDGRTSQAVEFPVVNPVPALASVVPDTVIAGSPGATLTLIGARFAPGASAAWNGAARATTFVSSTELRMELPASDLAAQGLGGVTVANPAPGGGPAPGAPLPVTIAAPAPVASAFAPASVPPGSARFTLTVSGTGFLPSVTVVRWNGADRPTTVVSPTVLHATISAEDVAAAGSAEVSVHTPPPGGGTAIAGAATIAAAAPPSGRAVAYQLEPGHSGRTSLGAAPVFPDAPAWSVALPDLASYPLIAGGRVFVVTRGTRSLYGNELRALDLATGALAWGPVTIDGTYYSATHAYDDGRVFVIDFDGNLRAFDAATGAPLWARQLGGWADSAPTAVGGVVYVGAGSLYAIDAADGTIRWRSAVPAGDHSSPAVSLDGLFVSYTCAVHKVDRLTGSEIWHDSGGCSGGGGRTAAYAADRLFVRDPYGATLQRPFGASYDAFDGAYLGAFGASATSSWLPIPAIGDDALYLVTGGVLQRSALVGAGGWTFTGDGTLASAPLLVDDLVVVGAGSGKVYAVDAATGVERWSGDAGAAVLGPDEHNVSSPLTGLGVGEGYLVVPAGSRVTAWKLVGP